MRVVVCLAVAACSSPSPAPKAPEPVAKTEPPDAAIDAPPDAGLSPELAAAPTWIFRFTSPERTETWTIRTAGTAAAVSVERPAGTTLYLGTVDGTKLAVVGPAAMTLDCKPDTLTVCTKTKPKKVPVRSCFHPDFKAPMMFAAAPGLEYSADGCKQGGGYRLID